MKPRVYLIIMLLALAWSPALLAGSFTGVEAMDAPNDSGGAVIVTWPRPAFEEPGGRYVIEAAASDQSPFQKVGGTLYGLGLKSENPKYFGWNADNKNAYAIEVRQAPPPAEWIAAQTAERAESLRVLNIQLEDVQKRIAAEDSPRLRTKLEARQTTLQKDIRRLSAPVNAVDPVGLTDGHRYLFRVRYLPPGQTVEIVSNVAAAAASSQWFDTNKTVLLTAMLLLSGLILWYIHRARMHPEKLYIRPIAGIEAIDDAIGRATEMGKPIFFVHGLAAMSSISTIAAVNILGKIAERVAEYGTTFKVTNRDPVVLAVSQETVKEAYLRSGRPDLYNDDNVFYVSQDQFSYASAVEGMFLREKPASNFFFGYYYAEALLLTETGASTGAIQIAGTDSYTQLPFFITTCDYTLMGEELYAASAYLSREPRLLGSVKAQDIGKTFMIAAIVIGAALSSLGIQWVAHLFETF